MDGTSPQQWKTLNRFVEFRSPWLTLIGENLQNEHNQVLDYWRVERVDSVVAITIQDEKLLFPAPMYRPGLGEATLDFPGGRVSDGQTPETAVRKLLEKELGVTEHAIAHLTPVNSTGWPINSAFSNQKLYGFVAELHPTALINQTRVGVTYPMTSEGIHLLLKDLTCLQCRAVLLEWQHQLISCQ